MRRRYESSPTAWERAAEKALYPTPRQVQASPSDPSPIVLAMPCDDRTCPCNDLDGSACHYVPTATTPAWHLPPNLAEPRSVSDDGRQGARPYSAPPGRDSAPVVSKHKGAP